MKNIRKKIKLVLILLFIVFGYLFSVRSALIHAVRTNNVKMANLLLLIGANPNTRDFFDGPIIGISIYNGNYELTKALITNGARVNVGTNVGSNAENPWSTPLLLAVKKNHKDIVELLLNAGADVNLKGFGGSALQMSAYYHINDTSVMEVLLDNNANANEIIESIGLTPLREACERKNGAAISELLQHGASVNTQDRSSGQTALMIVVQNGYYEGVKMLIDAGADVGIRNYENNTALEMAREKGDQRIISLLKNNARRNIIVTAGIGVGD